MRCEDWHERLQAVIDKHDQLEFSYGVSDCAQLPFDAIEALTGTLPEIFKGEYSDAAGARARMRERGCNNLAELFVAAQLQEVHPAFAGRGDVGIADYPGAIIGGGVVVLGLELIGKGYDGTVRLPRTALSRAFRVE